MYVTGLHKKTNPNKIYMYVKKNKTFTKLVKVVTSMERTAARLELFLLF